MAKITYTNKVTLNPQSSVADENKVTSGDMNEIKSVVNGLIVNSYSTFKGYGLRTYIGGNYRNITRNNDTSYTINPANSTDFNNALIPIYAIGYKTGLFS